MVRAEQGIEAELLVADTGADCLVGADTYAFRHSLTAEALRAALLEF